MDHCKKTNEQKLKEKKEFVKKFGHKKGYTIDKKNNPSLKLFNKENSSHSFHRKMNVIKHQLLIEPFNYHRFINVSSNNEKDTQKKLYQELQDLRQKKTH